MCGVRTRLVASYHRDARVGGKPGPLEVSVGDGAPATGPRRRGSRHHEGSGGQPGSRQSAGGEGRTLMDQVRRLLKPVRLPIPPRPQASRARRPDACVRRPVAQPSGPRRTRTVTPLLAGKLHCHSCYGPNVRGAGVEPAVHNAPGLRPGTVPRWQPAVGIGKLVATWQSATRSLCWRSLQLSRSYLGAKD
jgi:hypothetical protein